MSNMYALKEETLTALGDAVRGKSSNYIGGLPKNQGKIIYETSMDTATMPWKGSGNDINYQEPYFDFKTSLGDGYQYLDNLYCIFEYEGTNPEGFSIYIRDQSMRDYNFIHAGVIANEVIVPLNKSYNYRLQFNTKQTNLDNGAHITFTIKIWARDVDNNYIGLNTFTPTEMVDAINGLDIIPAEVLNVTGDCSYRFSNGGWDWFINQLGDKITTNNIITTSNMFYNIGLKQILFDINVSSDMVNIQNTFSYATKLEVVPYIIGPEKELPTSGYSGTLNLSYLFNNCQKLRYIPKDYFWKIVPNKDFWEKQFNISTQSQECIFGYCHSLRELPDISMLGGNWTSVYSSFYYNLLQFCYSLDEATNIPVCGTFTSNAMSNLFYNNYRLKEFMFLINEDGTPKTAKWKNQTIDTTSNSSKGTLGYGNYSPTNYNAGITADKEVKDDVTYQALKNDPDWYSRDINYSRYNHNSAVNTINSLPDTSAYGTNIIKFKGQAGALTDGGAINTLTEEEIAVATSKGWTVSLVS